MFHPFEQDLSGLKDQELDDKISELTRKYFAARRMGSFDLLTQLETFLTIYKEERSRRYAKKLNGDAGDDLGQLINVD